MNIVREREISLSRTIKFLLFVLSRGIISRLRIDIKKMKKRKKIIFQGKNKEVFIIAEAGKNFIQEEKDQSVAVYLKNAKRLVDEAAKAGVDAVKFQTHNVEDEILKVEFTSPYFPNWKKGGRYGWVSRITRGTPAKEFWLPLKKYCQNYGGFASPKKTDYLPVNPSRLDCFRGNFRGKNRQENNSGIKTGWSRGDYRVSAQ